MSFAIQLDNLSKTYRSGLRQKPVCALQNVSLSVAEGEAFGFIGPNGAGKSTAIRILLGLSQASSGNAALFSVPVTLPSARLGVAYVPESPYLYDYLTPLEILRMSMDMHAVRVDNAKVHCMAYLEQLGLAKVANTLLRSFSKGMVQRVAIAQALCIKSRLMILDEPLSGLDPIGRHDVVSLLAAYKQNGGTLFFTSHVLHDVERLADRFGLIHEGSLRSVRSPAELLGKKESCVIRTHGLTPVSGMQIEANERWSGQFLRDDLWSQLELLRAGGHVVIEVRPLLSLEQAFIQAVSQ